MKESPPKNKYIYYVYIISQMKWNWTRLFLAVGRRVVFECSFMGSVYNFSICRRIKEHSDLQGYGMVWCSLISSEAK